MIQFRIKDILNEQNKSIYWLAEETGITYPSLHKIVNNKTISIKLEFIELICKALNCTPTDILEIKKD